MDFTYQVLFISNFLICIIVMKLISFGLTKHKARSKLWPFVFTTPYVSTRSEKIIAPKRTYNIFLDFLVFTTLTGVMVTIAREYLVPLTYFKILLMTPMIYFMTEALGAFAQTLFIWNGKETFPIHHHPLFSKNLGQFWGRRWNLWVQDWFKDLNEFLSGKPAPLKIVFTFLISGFFHEIMVNLPYWILYKKSYFGTMMAYFIIQAAGLYLDKKFFVHASQSIRRIYLFMVVIIPSPLFINTPLLKFFEMTKAFN